MFDPGLSVGEVLTEKEVHQVFQCQTTLGIRMSKANNLFVIMSGSAKKNIYHDEWVGNTLLYNGTDCSSDEDGNQTLRTGSGNNNRQLFEVWDSPKDTRPQIFLFTKQEANKCVYKGEVYISEEPYWTQRHDDPSRKVIIFPLTLCETDGNVIRQNYFKAESEACDKTLDELKAKVAKKKKLNSGLPSARPRTVEVSYYERNPDVSAYAKVRANGYCDLCGKEAPFFDKNGKPYLEAHHIEWLSKGGSDTADNIVALCPNCHRKMHSLSLDEDVKKLKSRVEYYLINF